MVIAPYIEAAMRRAKFETLEDGSVYGEIKGLQGVWSNADTPEEAREELAEVLEEWILFRVSKGLPIPEVGGVSIKAPA